MRSCLPLSPKSVKMSSRCSRQSALIRNSCCPIVRRLAKPLSHSPRGIPCCSSSYGILVERSAARRSPSSPISVHKLRPRAHASLLYTSAPRSARRSSSLLTNWTIFRDLPTLTESSTKCSGWRAPSYASI